MTAATITARWTAWRARSLRAAVLFDDYASPADWNAINDAYSAAQWDAMTPAERWAWRIECAYQDVLAACQEAEIARALVGQAPADQSQFERQTVPGDMAAAKRRNQELEVIKEAARARARQALGAAIREGGRRLAPRRVRE